jgi:hypothetical protein
MTGVDLARRRLHGQRVIGPPFADPAAAVASLGAVQAQDYLGALWALGLRTRDATEAGVERAIADRRIVRTWPMRGTLHFVPAADARWMLELLTPREDGHGTGPSAWTRRCSRAASTSSSAPSAAAGG